MAALYTACMECIEHGAHKQWQCTKLLVTDTELLGTLNTLHVIANTEARLQQRQLCF
jgi:hypothetical protein